jgi:hypothetical protein
MPFNTYVQIWTPKAVVGSNPAERTIPPLMFLCPFNRDSVECVRGRLTTFIVLKGPRHRPFEEPPLNGRRLRLRFSPKATAIAIIVNPRWPWCRLSGLSATAGRRNAMP